MIMVPERGGADCGDAGKDGVRHDGEVRREVCELRRDDFYLYPDIKPFRPVWLKATHGGLRRNAAIGIAEFYPDPFQSV